MFDRKNAETIVNNIPILAREICLRNEKYPYVLAKSSVISHDGEYYIAIDMNQFKNKDEQEKKDQPELALFNLPISNDDPRILDKAIKRPQNLYTAVLINGDKDEDLSVICYYTDGSDEAGNEGLNHELMLNYIKQFEIDTMQDFVDHLNGRLDDYNHQTKENLTIYKVFPDYKKYL